MDTYKEINPDNFGSNFNSMSMEVIEKWEKVLVNSKTEYTKLVASDIDVEELTREYHNKKEIRNDCDRSRILERAHFNDFERLLEQLLILYCKVNNVPYKQGMNEIMGPLIFLKASFNISNSRIINLFSCFVDNFLTNYYYELELFAFRSSVSLLTLLLRYHDPGLFNAFEHGGISPQMYATNWLLTTYANKLQLGIVYKLWDAMIEENDQLFIHFIVIAFLQHKKHLFIGVDSSQILLSFSKIKIDTMGELREIIATARKLRLFTPFSFRILVQKLEIFKPRSQRLKELYAKYNTDEMITLPILPSEFIYIMFNDLIKCPDSQSQKNHSYSIPGSTFIMNQEDECYYCNLPEKQSKQYIVIDLRILKRDEEFFNEGSLPVKTLFTRENLIQDEIDIEKLICEKIEEHKSKAHIILITNDTLYFPRYEQRFYSDKSSFNLFVSTLFGKSQKVEREINQKEVKNLIKSNAKLKKRYKLKEYENIKKIIAYLQNKEYPHVSYLYGGFREVHELAMKYSISLINHNVEKCEFCVKNKAKNEQIDLFYKLYGGKSQGSTSMKQSPSSQSPIKSSPSPKEDRKEAIEILNLVKAKVQEESSGTDRYNAPIDYVEVDKMNEFVKDSLNTVFHCMLLKHNKHGYKDKIIAIFNFDTMRIYKMLVDSSEHLSNGSKVNFGMLDIIKCSNIKSYSRDKSVFDVEYDWMNSKSEEETLQRERVALDLFTDIDCDNFANELEEIIAMYQRTKSKDSRES